MANNVDVKFSADISDLQKGMRQASAEIDAANRDMRNGAAQIAAAFGALSAAYANNATRRVSVAKNAGDDALAIAREQETAQFDIAMNGVKMQEAVLKSAAQTSQINHEQERAGLLALENERESIELRHLQMLQSTYDVNSTEYARMQRKMDEVASQSALRRVQIEANYNKEIYNDYRHTFEQIGSSVSSAIMGMIQGQESLRRAAQKVLLAIIQDFIQTRIRMVADWLAGQVAMTIATTTAQSQQTGAVAAGQAAQTAAVASGAQARSATAAQGLIPTLIADAKGVFGGVFSFLSPILGPAAAAPAAGAAGMVMSGGGFAQGSWELSSDMIAQIHKGEMIVPASHTPWAQDLLANAAGAGGGDVHHHFAPTINFTAGGGLTRQQLRDHADTLVSILKDAHGRGAFAGYNGRPGR